MHKGPGLCLHQPREGRETAQGLAVQGSDTLRSARKGSSRQGLLGPKALNAPDPVQWGRPEGHTEAPDTCSRSLRSTRKTPIPRVTQKREQSQLMFSQI